jgi:hypothetical protein
MRCMFLFVRLYFRYIDPLLIGHALGPTSLLLTQTNRSLLPYVPYSFILEVIAPCTSLPWGNPCHGHEVPAVATAHPSSSLRSPCFRSQHAVLCMWQITRFRIYYSDIVVTVAMSAVMWRVQPRVVHWHRSIMKRRKIPKYARQETVSRRQHGLMILLEPRGVDKEVNHGWEYTNRSMSCSRSSLASAMDGARYELPHASEHPWAGSRREWMECLTMGLSMRLKGIAANASEGRRNSWTTTIKEVEKKGRNYSKFLFNTRFLRQKNNVMCQMQVNFVPFCTTWKVYVHFASSSSSSKKHEKTPPQGVPDNTCMLGILQGDKCHVAPCRV